MAIIDEMTGNGAPSWPYPVDYGKENELFTDVLVIGGGIAGCHAAINAARRGSKVIVLEKGATVHSGCSGAGVDTGEQLIPTRLVPPTWKELPRPVRKGVPMQTVCSAI